MDPIQLRDVTETAAHCKKLALPLNFDEHMVRYEFRTLQKRGTEEEWMARTSEYIKQWIELSISEKRSHMNITDRTLWPQRLPWVVSDVFDMPIVLWMSKGK